MIYASMKQQIEKFLLENGFQKNGEEYFIIQERVVGQMIINGVQRDQTQTVKLAFVYVGECEEEIEGQWVKNRTQWQLKVNDEMRTEVLVSSLSEFKEFFKI